MPPVQAVDLFCGAGGASKGLADAGVEVVLAIDNHAPALEIHKFNHEVIPVVEMALGGSIAEVSTLLRNYLDKDAHFHLHGSPPCQELSNASTYSNQDGMAMVNWFLELVAYMSPESWSMENVPPIAKFLKKQNVPYVLINAADYGIPQTRERVFAGGGWTIIPPTHQENAWVSMRAALPHITTGYLKTYGKHVRQRGLDEPSRTVTGSVLYRLTVGDESRALTVSENAALQGWPEMRFPSRVLKMHQWRAVGNLVCPGVMEAVIKGLHIHD